VIIAYVDTSCLVAIAFSEPGAAAMRSRLRGFDRLLASNLLEAELRAALARENVDEDPNTFLSWISWIYPNRPLTGEFQRILVHGYVKGADLWHLACAVFATPEETGLTFLTLDTRQKAIARALGFAL